MSDFGELTKVPLREIWTHEATEFTPWLAKNVEALGDALGLELELIEREASVGDFSLDLLAIDLGTSRNVIIENQFSQTDHDHLGKLLTYGAGFDASTVIWISEIIRDEHRQALDWLNQKTDTDTSFFGVVIEVLKIDESKPAFNFKVVVSPNEWQKQKKRNASRNTSSKGEKYRSYYQELIDELREKHRFTSAKSAQPRSFYSFSSGIQGIRYGLAFAKDGQARAEVYIDQGEQDKNKQIFDALFDRKDEITSSFGSNLEWERLDEKRASRIYVFREGYIEQPDTELEIVKNWQIQQLLKIKEVFTSEIQEALNRIG